MAGEINGLVAGKSDFSRLWVVLALCGSLGASGLSVVGTQDRYFGKDAARDQALLRAEMQNLRQAVLHNTATIERIDATHPPSELTDAVALLTEKVWAIELARAKEQAQRKAQ